VDVVSLGDVAGAAVRTPWTKGCVLLGAADRRLPTAFRDDRGNHVKDHRALAHRRIESRGRVAIAAIAGVGAGLVAGCGQGGGETLKVVSGPSHRAIVDLGPSGKSPGDISVFDSSLLDAHGHTVGRVHGMTVSIKRGHSSETAQGTTTYEFGSGNSIVVGGLVERPLRGPGTLANRTFTRAILGETGKYAGVTGAETLKRRSDGRYEPQFRLER
jgi:hypothetical protein